MKYLSSISKSFRPLSMIRQKPKVEKIGDEIKEDSSFQNGQQIPHDPYFIEVKDNGPGIHPK